MAMVVESVVSRHKPWLQWHGIGTDISFNAIHHAQQAIYPEAAMEFDSAAVSGQLYGPKTGWTAQGDRRHSRQNAFFPQQSAACG